MRCTGGWSTTATRCSWISDLRDGIVVGEEWEQRLHERLRWADAVVCLLTSAYLGVGLVYRRAGDRADPGEPAAAGAGRTRGEPSAAEGGAAGRRGDGHACGPGEAGRGVAAGRRRRRVGLAG